MAGLEAIFIRVSEKNGHSVKKSLNNGSCVAMIEKCRWWASEVEIRTRTTSNLDA